MSDNEAAPAAPEHLNIKVTDNNNEVFFKIKRTTQLKKLMDAFCDRQGKDPSTVRFLFDGTRVQAQDTPDTVRPSLLLMAKPGLEQLLTFLSLAYSWIWPMGILSKSTRSRLGERVARYSVFTFYTYARSLLFTNFMNVIPKNNASNINSVYAQMLQLLQGKAALLRAFATSKAHRAGYEQTIQKLRIGSHTRVLDQVFTVMDAKALLMSQGWSGPGNPLNPGRRPGVHGGLGLTKPILVARKQNTLGVGKKTVDHSNQWWLRGFEAALKGVGSPGTATPTSQESYCSGISAGSELHRFFVSGGVLVGTIEAKTEKSSAQSDAGVEEHSKKFKSSKRKRDDDTSKDSQERAKRKEEKRKKRRMAELNDSRNDDGTSAAKAKDKAEKKLRKKEKLERKKQKAERKDQKEKAKKLKRDEANHSAAISTDSDAQGKQPATPTSPESTISSAQPSSTSKEDKKDKKKRKESSSVEDRHKESGKSTSKTSRKKEKRSKEKSS
ncbi:hypothetical protein KEM56_001050 [Ascosphaera pollenicola]|nr:hypothetical protein KEM56_001050 [Ascosphaera pollenicola]